MNNKNSKLQIYKGMIQYVLESTNYTLKNVADLSNFSITNIRLIHLDNCLPKNFSSITIRNYVTKLEVTLKTVRNILTPLRNMLDQALNDGLITSNPSDKLVLSKLVDKKTRKSDWQVDPFDLEEIKAILSEAKEQARNLFQFAFYTGLRTSELIALEWGDIDWLKGSVRVSRAVVLKKKVLKQNQGKGIFFYFPLRWKLYNIKKCIPF